MTADYSIRLENYVTLSFKNHIVLLEAQRCLTDCGQCTLPDTAVAFVRTHCGPLTLSKAMIPATCKLCAA